MCSIGWFAIARFRAATAVLLVLIGACRSSSPSRDGALSDSVSTAIESGRMDVDGPPSPSDAASDPWQAATESGTTDVDATSLPSDVGTRPDAAIDTMEGGRDPDAAIDTMDVGASPDAATDSRDVGLTPLDLGAEGDGAARSDASMPAGCAGQDIFVDVSDGHSTTRLAYSEGSSIPLATGNESAVTISVSENPNGGGASFGVDLTITGPQSATTRRVSWTPAGQSTSMTDCCGGACGGVPVTITRFDTGGGILEGDFEYFAVGYSCEGPDAILNGHFRVCYTPTS